MSMRYMSALGAVMVLGLLLAGSIDAAPYQELEPRDGYVPVYIREGDTPLLEINPKLAEAFNEIDTKNLLEQVDDETDAEKKPDLILMTIDDDGEAMLIVKPADQVMAENEPAEVLTIDPVPVSEGADEEASSDTANVDQPEEDDAPHVETNSQQLEEAKEAMKELVNVLEVEMLKKLSLAVTEKPVADDKKNDEEDDEPVAAAVDSSNDEDHKIIKDDEAEEPATDVLSVDDFKTKEIDVKSIENEKIDVPEEDTPEEDIPEDTVSKDE